MIDIKDLEKQIELLDVAYKEDIERPITEKMPLNIGQTLDYWQNINLEYIPKKIELEVELGFLKRDIQNIKTN